MTHVHARTKIHCNDSLKEQSSSGIATVVTQYRDLRMALLFLIISLLASLWACAKAAECSVKPGESQYDAHHFVCTNYYEALITSLERDKNELYWLETLFFPASKSTPHTLSVTAAIHVGNIGLSNSSKPANCSHSKEPAFFCEGAFWVRDWLMSLNDSPIPSFAPIDMLFAFDSTVTWAVYAMTTGLGSAVSKGGNIRFFITSLPCMPSLEVMTEVLEEIMSEVSQFVQGPRYWWIFVSCKTRIKWHSI